LGFDKGQFPGRTGRKLRGFEAEKAVFGRPRVFLRRDSTERKIAQTRHDLTGSRANSKTFNG
jgi:hypothetical protein